jgi:hypothetical protein
MTAHFVIGIEGEFLDRVTSKEHYVPQFTTYPTRQMPELRQSLLPKPMDHMQTETTYHRMIGGTARFDGLQPKKRFDPALKKPDNIDWM